MNFDYLHKIGTISDEQYDEINPNGSNRYNKLMHEFNEGNDVLIAKARNNGEHVGTCTALD
jgi:hypothetical protein